MSLYSINIDLSTSNYHIWVIDVRSYNKDSYHITSHSQATLLVGVHPVHPTISQTSNLPFIGGESMLIGSIIDVFSLH